MLRIYSDLVVVRSECHVRVVNRGLRDGAVALELHRVGGHLVQSGGLLVAGDVGVAPQHDVTVYARGPCDTHFRLCLPQVEELGGRQQLIWWQQIARVRQRFLA